MARKLNNIVLVPTDFSETCQNAATHAAKLAKQVDYKVTLLHVINRESKSKLGAKEIEAGVARELEKAAKELKKKAGVKVDYLYRDGSIFHVINQVAEEIGANIMVLGTHGKKGLQYLFGSYALRVISESPVPVLVVQRRGVSGHGYKKVVFPISIHTEARQQVRHAVAASNLFGSKILILQQNLAGGVDDSKIPVITEQIEKEFKKNGVKYSVDKASTSSNFAKQLVDFAVAKTADMILMMTDSNIESPDFNNSSWSEKIMFNEAQIPVLCINPVYLGQIFFPF